MGLDMYAFAVHVDNAKGDFDFVTEEEDREEFMYWRKHNALHSWMQKLYRAKGGTAKEFNCIPLRLTQEDLLALIADAKSHKLQSASGFFWGGPYIYNDEIANQDIEFAHKALVKIDQGFAVYYDSWW